MPTRTNKERYKIIIKMVSGQTIVTPYSLIDDEFVLGVQNFKKLEYMSLPSGGEKIFINPANIETVRFSKRPRWMFWV